MPPAWGHQEGQWAPRIPSATSSEAVALADRLAVEVAGGWAAA